MRRNCLYKILLIFLLLQLPGTGVFAQLTVVQGAAMGMTPLQLVQNYLVGAGVTVSNVTFNGSAANITSDQVGTFTTAGIAANQLGLAGGILMTSGKANIAIGPNNSGSAGNQVGGPGDPDLNTLSGSTTFDRAVIEFDFVPQSDTIRFRYVFGSEEFFEYCNQFNDAFGFFLSGPGINGTFSNNSVNIARMPGSLNNYVTINNICDNTLSRWNNAGGQYYQYDGLTYVYTAWYAITPCSTYHIKLVIGDAVDKAYDSGVFLEQNSFSSPAVNMINNNTIPQLHNTAVEGCNDVAVNFRLMATLNYPYTVNFSIGGTAVNGLDYTQIPSSVTFQPGEDSVNILIHPIQDNLPEGPQTVILTINQISCDGSIKSDTLYIDDYTPMTIEPNPDQTLCFGTEIELRANTTGGVMPLSYYWNIPGSDSTVTFIPPVGNQVYTVKVTDICSHSVYDTALVTVHPVPVADAGPDKTIPNGTSTTLQGGASNGYGNYSFSWTSNPPGFTSSEQNPSTGNLSSTRIFILVVTDLVSGCQSLPSQVMIIVAGGPLSVNPVVQPEAVCQGDTAQLFALAGGGSGLYTYEWISVPPGFNSAEADPRVNPQNTTTYRVIVNDGFNSQSSTTTLTVYPLPVIDIGPADTTVCIFDSVWLDAGNAGSTYLWSDGTTGRFKVVTTTGIGFDVQTFTVEVVTPDGCRNEATTSIAFSFDECVGIGELVPGTDFIIYPNPANKSFRLKMNGFYKPFSCRLYDFLGRCIIDQKLLNGDEERVVEIDHLVPGLYLVRVEAGSRSGTARLVVY